MQGKAQGTVSIGGQSQSKIKRQLLTCLRWATHPYFLLYSTPTYCRSSLHSYVVSFFAIKILPENVSRQSFVCRTSVFFFDNSAGRVVRAFQCELRSQSSPHRWQAADACFRRYSLPSGHSRGTHTTTFGFLGSF